MAFGLPSGGVNMQWLVDLINSMRGGGGPGGPTNQYATGQQPNEVYDLRRRLAARSGGGPLPSIRLLGRLVPGPAADLEAAPPRTPSNVVGQTGAQSPAARVISRMIQKPAGPVSTGLGRSTEAMPAGATPLRTPALAPAPVAPETEQGPSLNEPPIPELAAPEQEPTGDAALLESALQHPDLLRQAEGGDMTSLDLLKALLERRAQGPRDIGGPQ